MDPHGPGTQGQGNARIEKELDDVMAHVVLCMCFACVMAYVHVSVRHLEHEG